MKHCSKCNGELPADNPKWCGARCHPCVLQAQRDRYRLDKEARKAKVAEWQRSNPEKVASYKKRYQDRKFDEKGLEIKARRLDAPPGRDFEINREELAWAAGFFDGEGSVGCYTHENGSGYRSPRLMLQIAQTDRFVLDRFQAAVGIGRVTGPFTPKTENSNPYWCLRTESFANVQSIVSLMWVWLSPIKRADAKRAISKYLRWANNGLCQWGHPREPGRRCRTCSSISATNRWRREREGSNVK